ncbi:MAG: aspartate kinase [Sulfobacillus acidophilus]|uniref:Aspartokinase n=1 Tax=Sulfobacillus acidophilus TaxID=53633 RepID=A0A2T2WLX3_9FIRM|nr:MAG: aspartate kinase [Sulfobacillus acidophilus]
MRVVQKFGGSSLKNVELLRAVARRVHETVQSGHDVVVVVSAMGDTTDELLERAQAVSGGESPSNLDFLMMTGEMQSAALMAMELSRLGTPAQALSGAQAGIYTNREFGQARIHEVKPQLLEKLLAQHTTPVVTGFQGVSADGFYTTLGRGGSDLTAIALASALTADSCEIYSDVAGVFTADPRVVPNARALQSLSYDEMLELASQGAQVLQTQAVLYARQSGVTVQARSTFEPDPGTRIEITDVDDAHPVTAVALDVHLTKLGLVGVPDRPGVAAFACERLAQAGINIDLVFQALSHENARADIALTVADRDRARAEAVCEETLRELGGSALVVDGDIAKVSAVGAGVRNHVGVAATLFRALADASINIQMISTSEIKVSCIVARADATRALNQVHDAFGLG